MAAAVSVVAWLWAYAGLVCEFFVQRWHLRRLGPASRACHASIKGRTCVVTGATSGIGLEIAKELARAGAHVVLACRNEIAAQKLANSWQRELGQCHVEVVKLDLSSLASVRDLAAQWGPDRPIHALINNAGVFSMGRRQKVSDEGLEEHILVNYLAPALLTLLLLPNLRKGASAAATTRIVNVSSEMHATAEINFEDLNYLKHRTYRRVTAYSQSKLAQILFTNALQRRLPASSGIDVIALHPGICVTNVARDLPKPLQLIYKNVLRLFCLSASEGARSALFCATQPSVDDSAASVCKTQCGGGPYFGSDCCPGRVAKHASSVAAAEYCWEHTLPLLHLPGDIVQQQLDR